MNSIQWYRLEKSEPIAGEIRLVPITVAEVLYFLTAFPEEDITKNGISYSKISLIGRKVLTEVLT